MNDVTKLTGKVGAGDDAGRNELFTAVYAELRAIAARKMASERAGHTLQATALVHEAWLSFGARKFENRAHFFAAAAEAMRRILVDSARQRSRLKRGGDFERVERSKPRSPLLTSPRSFSWSMRPSIRWLGRIR